jgi:hypothetical protein
VSQTPEWQLDQERLAAINFLLQRQDDVLVYNCMTRSAQESKLFPVMPYLMNVMVESYYRYPDVVRESMAHISPEEVGHRAREVSTNLSGLTSWAVLNYYLNGRAWLIRTGIITPHDNLEDLWTVADWWTRFQRSYRRNDGHLNTLDAWDVHQTHSERVLQVFEADAFECDDRLRSATNKFLAASTQYSFLVNCESRSGLHAAGPYRLGGDRIMQVRDVFNLAECDFSWLDGVAADVPYNNVSVVLISSGVRVEITDWGTPYTQPEEYSQKIVGVGLYTSDYLSDRYIPVSMDSRDGLADTLEQLADVCAAATRKLYSRYAEMTNQQMIEAGVYTYLSAANPLSHMAGTYRQDQWEVVDERVRRFWPLMNEEYAMDAYLDHFAFQVGHAGAPSDYFLHPVSYRTWRPDGGDLPAGGRSAFLVSENVLRDHDYSRRVNATGKVSVSGTSSLPPKTALFTTTQGKLTEAEANEAARAFSSPLMNGQWCSIDDEWVKWHAGDPDVEEMYRYTQQSSRLLSGRGAGLTRREISALRLGAGESPWGVS